GRRRVRGDPALHAESQPGDQRARAGRREARHRERAPRPQEPGRLHAGDPHHGRGPHRGHRRICRRRCPSVRSKEVTPARRRKLIRLGVWATLLIGIPLWLYSCMIPMPGRSHRGPLPPLTSKQAELAATLRRDVVELAEKIGERNTFKYEALRKAADYV